MFEQTFKNIDDIFCGDAEPPVQTGFSNNLKVTAINKIYGRLKVFWFQISHLHTGMIQLVIYFVLTHFTDYYTNEIPYSRPWKYWPGI